MTMDEKDAEAKADRRPVAIYFICSCCGESCEVQDVEAVLRSLHLTNSCPAMEGVLR